MGVAQINLPGLSFPPAKQEHFAIYDEEVLQKWCSFVVYFSTAKNNSFQIFQSQPICSTIPCNILNANFEKRA